MFGPWLSCDVDVTSGNYFCSRRQRSPAAPLLFSLFRFLTGSKNSLPTNLNAKHLDPRKQKNTHRFKQQLRRLCRRTLRISAKFMCSNHTNHISYNHTHARVNSRSRFEVSGAIFGRRFEFIRQWWATIQTISLDIYIFNFRFWVAREIQLHFGWSFKIAVLLCPLFFGSLYI